jgi:hypothetical protein
LFQRGRQKGTPNERTVEGQQKAAEVAEALKGAIPELFEGDSHALMIAIYKDPRHPIETQSRAR